MEPSDYRESAHRLPEWFNAPLLVAGRSLLCNHINELVPLVLVGVRGDLLVQVAVNHRVAGSSLARGATKLHSPTFANAPVVFARELSSKRCFIFWIASSSRHKLCM